jgi:succinate dehydrogenase / fumarate reductase cytochrome b subunit
VPGEVYDNVVADFSRWYVTLAYTVAMIALGFHLRRGAWSALQTRLMPHWQFLIGA